LQKGLSNTKNSIQFLYGKLKETTLTG